MSPAWLNNGHKIAFPARLSAPLPGSEIYKRINVNQGELFSTFSDAAFDCSKRQWQESVEVAASWSRFPMQISSDSLLCKCILVVCAYDFPSLAATHPALHSAQIKCHFVLEFFDFVPSFQGKSALEVCTIMPLLLATIFG